MNETERSDNKNETKRNGWNTSVECNGNDWIENGSVYIWCHGLCVRTCVCVCVCVLYCTMHNALLYVALRFVCLRMALTKEHPVFQNNRHAIQKESSKLHNFYAEIDWHIAWLVILVLCVMSIFITNGYEYISVHFNNGHPNEMKSKENVKAKIERQANRQKKMTSICSASNVCVCFFSCYLRSIESFPMH